MKTYKIKTPGLSGNEWVKRLENKGYKIGTYAKQILQSPDFKSQNGECEIAIIKAGDVGFNPTTKEIKDYAKSKGYLTLAPEIGCLIREIFSDEEIKTMGLWYIVTMHEPIKDSVGDPRLLGSYRFVGGRWLNAYYGRPDDDWDDAGGFAFAVPQDTLDSDTESSSDTLNLDLAIKTVKEAGYKIFKEI